MAKKNLLLCFDAFGTLIRPKLPISQQYSQVARQCDLSGLKDNQIEASFRAAFRAEKKHINDGRHSYLGVTRWWENKKLYALIPQPLRRFSLQEDYTIKPHLLVLLDAIQQQSHTHNSGTSYDQIMVGVISNSDDRIMSVLSSFGVHVGPSRYDNASQIERIDGAAGCARYDVSFHCLSYGVGFEKPDLRIFRAAEPLLLQVLKVHGSVKLDVDPSHTNEYISTS